MVETNKTDESSSSKNQIEKTTLHPAYTVTNINLKVRTLDGKKTPYANWVKLFKLHLTAYKVLNHVDGTTKVPDKEDPTYADWVERDALILQWIYATISDDILNRVLDTETTARAAWLRIQEIFVNNKHARATTLEQKFTNCTLAASASFDEYCQTLKDIAAKLADIDQPVSESRLVIQMVRGLPVEFDMIGALINQRCPTWDTARSMIESEQQRQMARSGSNRESVMLNSQSPSSVANNSVQSRDGTTPSPYPNGYRGNNYDPVKAARGRGRGNNTRGRDGGRNNMDRGSSTWHPPQSFGSPTVGPSTNYPQQTNYPMQAQHAQLPAAQFNNRGPMQNSWTNQTPQWAPPPTPYPSQPAQLPYQQAHVAAHHPPPGFSDYSSLGYNALSPSDIGMAMTSLNLNQPDPQWYMDTDASSHITSDLGPQGWATHFPPQQQ